MTVAQYLRLLRVHWLLVTVMAVLGTAGAGAYSLLATPVYESTVQVFIAANGPAGSVAEMTTTGAFMEQRVKSYTQLVSSPKVLRPVIEKLRLGVTPESLATRVTASSPLDTVLINVSVTDTSARRASDIANAVAESFAEVIASVETPRPGLGARATAAVTPLRVTVSVTRDAVPATAPVSPRTSLNLALGLLVGLGLGIGGAVLRQSLDRTVGRRLAERLTEAPVLAVVGDDPDAASRPLLPLSSVTPRAEAYRRLRSNIRFLKVDHSVRSLVVTGSVSSEGKTTTAANLAIALAQAGEDVVLIDADLRRPNVHNLFGLPSGVGLTSVLVGDAPLDVALQSWRDDLSLRVLASGPLPPNPAELIASERMAGLIAMLTGQGRTVIVDSPPLVPVNDAAVLARVTDGALLVVRAGTTRIEQLTTSAEALRTARASVLGVVLNRVPRGKNGVSGYGYGYTDEAYQTYSRTPEGAARVPAIPPAPAQQQAAAVPAAVPPVPATVPTLVTGQAGPVGHEPVISVDLRPHDAPAPRQPSMGQRHGGPLLSPYAVPGPSPVAWQEVLNGGAGPVGYPGMNGFNGSNSAYPVVNGSPAEVNGVPAEVNGVPVEVNGAAPAVNGHRPPMEPRRSRRMNPEARRDRPGR